MIGKRTVDRALTIAAAAAAPLLSLLTRHHVLTAADATDIGTVVLALVSGYHGGAYVQRNRATTPPDVERAKYWGSSSTGLPGA